MGVSGIAAFVMADQIQRSCLFRFHKKYPITLVIKCKCKKSQNIWVSMKLYLFLKLFSDVIMRLFTVNFYLFELTLPNTSLFQQTNNKFPEDFLRLALLLLSLLVQHISMLSYFSFCWSSYVISATVYCRPLGSNFEILVGITFVTLDLKQYFEQNILSHFVLCPSIFHLPSSTRFSVMALKQGAKQNVCTSSKLF